jgi:hypothetical protein
MKPSELPSDRVASVYAAEREGAGAHPLAVGQEGMPGCKTATILDIVL